MNQPTKTLTVILLVAVLSGCGAMTIEDFAGTEPTLDLFDYFEGETTAWGVFEDRFGSIRRQLKVELRGRIEGDELILDEQFAYSDGEIDQRTWRIRRDSRGGYVGRAADIVGEAIGQASGNAVNWRYTMDLKVGQDSWRVDFDDWMLLQSDGVLINRAWVKKLGLTVGTVSLFFRKSAPAFSVGMDASAPLEASL